MERIAICICTYKRPAGLQAALASIGGQRLERLGDAQISVIVTDNSPDGASAGFCREHAKTSRFALTYVHQPLKGLVRARNACLDAARNAGATHAVFIDDDEIAPPGWLEALFARLAETGAVAAVGPVFPVFAATPSPWLPTECYVNRPRVVDAFAEDGHTCNAIVDLRAVTACDLRFDIRFNDTGGEDTAYFKALQCHGSRIAWAENADIYETVPLHRMTANWLFRRWFRTGNVETQFGTHPAASTAERLGNLGKGVIRIGAGCVRVAVAAVMYSWRDPARVIASFYTLCRGAGYITGALGASYKEYARRGYR